jgi:phage terminase small subunit
MGRNGQPIDLLVAKGKKHLTAKEKELRKKAEIKFGGRAIACPDYVLKNDVALDKWAEISALYEGFDFVSAGDSGLIARYCMTYSEYLDLIQAFQRVKEVHYDCDELDEAINGTYIDEDTEREKQLFSAKVKKQLRDLFAISALLTIETAINQKMKMLIAMEDRLFLNPLAKVKNIPKQKAEEPEDKLKAAGYDI